MGKLLQMIGLTGLALSCYFSPLNNKEVSAEMSNKPFRGLCYGPFREGQSPEWGIYPTEQQVREDLTNKIIYLTGKIRTYGNENILYRIPEFCRDAGIDCYPGAWVDNQSVTEDANQVARLIQIGKANYPTTRALVVGSEFLYRRPTKEGQLISWLNQVRSETGKLVSANEQWHIYRDYPNMVNAVDFGLVNIYPFWENQSIEGAAQFILEKYNFLKNRYPGKKFIIGETGWPSSGPANGNAVPSMENQRRFIKEFIAMANSNDIDYLFFEATDEPWKGEGGVGGHWGILDKNRHLKESVVDILRENTFLSHINGNKVSIQTYEGNKYCLERNLNLGSTNWVSVTNFLGRVGTNNTTLNLDPGLINNNRGFFRAKLGL